MLREYLKRIADTLKNQTNDQSPLNAQYFPNAIEDVCNMKSNEGYFFGYEDGYWEGHNEGYEEGYSDGDSFGYYNGYNTGLTEGYDNGFNEGKQAEYDAFWDEFQNYGKPKSYANTFSYNSWNDKTYNPKYPIVTLGCNNMFTGCELTDTKVPIDLSQSSNTQQFYIFQSATKMKTIRKLILRPNMSFSQMFDNCKALENIVVEGVVSKSLNMQWSSLLTKDSITSIVGCLSATSTDQTLTLSQTAVDNAFTTEEWNTLIADKTNWTISLV